MIQSVEFYFSTSLFAYKYLLTCNYKEGIVPTSGAAAPGNPGGPGGPGGPRIDSPGGP